MPQHDAYMLHIYRSRTVSGWQWAARLEHVPGRTSQRFTDSETLLARLRTVIREGDQGELPAEAVARGKEEENEDAI